MENHCLNCNVLVSGNYCSNCGQSSATHRISVSFLWHDIQHGLFHFDKGFLFTSFDLFKRPGNSIREFIEGKRIKHFKPISLVLILAGVYGFLSHYLDVNLLSNNIQVTGSGEKFNATKELVSKMSDWLAQHYSLFALIQIPIFSLGTFLAFKKSGYNFVEHIIMNTFLTAQRIILHLLSFPLLYIFNGTNELKTTARIIDLIGFALMIISLYQLFNFISLKKRLVGIIVSFVISFIILYSLMAITFKLIIATV